jgi:hypothetical protein
VAVKLGYLKWTVKKEKEEEEEEVAQPMTVCLRSKA